MRANKLLRHIVRIRRLGLEVVEAKTEAILFDRHTDPNGVSTTKVGDTYIPLGKRLKYLGVIIDNYLAYTEHLIYILSTIFVLNRLIHSA